MIETYRANGQMYIILNDKLTNNYKFVNLSLPINPKDLIKEGLTAEMTY